MAVSNANTSSGEAYRARTSTDDVNWAAHPVPALGWTAATFGGTLFAAATAAGTVVYNADGSTRTIGASAIMASPDGINWTALTAAADSLWASVTYGDGLIALLWHLPGLHWPCPGKGVTR